MAAFVKGFGCRRVVDACSRTEGRRPKASEEGTRGKAVSAWPTMGIWRLSGCSRGWFCGDRRELSAGDDSGVASAAVLDGLIGDWSEMLCQCSQVPGW